MKKAPVKKRVQQAEYDFALVFDGVPELTARVEDALFGAGCDDATFSMQYGHLYAEFSRRATSLKDAIVSALRDVKKARIGAVVVRVDEPTLVTPAEIARRIGRSRQLVHQYMTGQRGPGRFPAPECHLAAGAPLWSWGAVSHWLAANDLIRPEDGTNAEVVAAVNNYLERAQQRRRSRELVDDVVDALAAVAPSAR